MDSTLHSLLIGYICNVGTALVTGLTVLRSELYFYRLSTRPNNFEVGPDGQPVPKVRDTSRKGNSELKKHACLSPATMLAS